MAWRPGEPAAGQRHCRHPTEHTAGGGGRSLLSVHSLPPRSQEGCSMRQRGAVSTSTEFPNLGLTCLGTFLRPGTATGTAPCRRGASGACPAGGVSRTEGHRHVMAGRAGWGRRGKTRVRPGVCANPGHRVVGRSRQSPGSSGASGVQEVEAVTSGAGRAELTSAMRGGGRPAGGQDAGRLSGRR